GDRYHAGEEVELPHVGGVDRLFGTGGGVLDVSHDIGQLLGLDLAGGRRVLPHIVAVRRGDIVWRHYLLLRGILGKIEEHHALVVFLPHHRRETSSPRLQLDHLYVLRHGGTRGHGNGLRAEPP